MAVEDNPHFLDLIAFQAANTLFVTKNGFRNFLSLYRNAEGQTTVLSPTVSGSVKLSDRVRADLGFRYEWNYFVQSAENTSTFNLDGNAATTYDNETFGNGSFRHFKRTIGDWAASAGVNYALAGQTSIFVQGSRGYKMPALGEFIDPTGHQRVDALRARTILAGAVRGEDGPRPVGVTRE